MKEAISNLMSQDKERQEAILKDFINHKNIEKYNQDKEGRSMEFRNQLYAIFNPYEIGDGSKTERKTNSIEVSSM